MNWNISEKSKQFNSISNEINELYHKIALSIGISDSAYEIFYAILSLGEGITQTQIYKNGCLNKQTINSSIKQLEKNNLIYLKKTTKENYIYLTKEGKKFVYEKILPFEKIEQDVLEELTEEEYSKLLNLMNRYLLIYKNKIKNILNDKADLK